MEAPSSVACAKAGGAAASMASVAATSAACQNRKDFMDHLVGLPGEPPGGGQTSAPSGSRRTSKLGQALAAYWLWPVTLRIVG